MKERFHPPPQKNASPRRKSCKITLRRSPPRAKLQSSTCSCRMPKTFVIVRILGNISHILLSKNMEIFYLLLQGNFPMSFARNCQITSMQSIMFRITAL